MPAKNTLLPSAKLFAFALCFAINTSQAQSTLPTSKPETEGIPAAAIDSFLTAVGQSKHEFHSFMMLRHGKVVAQGWWNPYEAKLRHTLYSCSKSFTSTAIGFAVSEKRLTVNDKVVSFFPDKLPDTIPAHLAALTVKDLLTMSVGQEQDPTFAVASTQEDWVKGFLALPIANKPGTKFLYNSLATFMLSAIVQKVTGQKEVDYLKPRLFEPLGIKGQDWEVNKQGINTGGWGLRVQTEALAKMGQLYLQKGKWQGKQVLPAAWVEEATTAKIDQAPGAPQSKKDSSDWMQGYCYQFWRCRNNAFRADGAFGQYIVVMPDQDAVIAITSESPDMQGELNLVWKYLLPAMQPKPLPANASADKNLDTHLANLKLAPLSGSDKGTFNQNFTVKPNLLNIKAIGINIKDGICHISLKKDAETYNLDFATGKWLPGETAMQGPGIVNGAKEDFSILQPYKIVGSYAFTEGKELQLKLRYIESPHTETIICKFDGKNLTADVGFSYTYGKDHITLQGELAE
ncbi:serine hydrolase domain-containing protein [Mucilaginibacter pedocola]|nr:serine hydrolase [Mucilaginibacter pedocola]